MSRPGMLAAPSSSRAASRSDRLVNDPHLLFVHSATLHTDRRESQFELTKVRRPQRNIDGSRVLLQVIDVARPWDRHDPWLLGQEPCKGNLRRCGVLLFGKPLEEIDNRPICRPGVRRKAIEAG